MAQLFWLEGHTAGHQKGTLILQDKGWVGQFRISSRLYWPTRQKGEGQTGWVGWHNTGGRSPTKSAPPHIWLCKDPHRSPLCIWLCKGALHRRQLESWWSMHAAAGAQLARVASRQSGRPVRLWDEEAGMACLSPRTSRPSHLPHCHTIAAPLSPPGPLHNPNLSTHLPPLAPPHPHRCSSPRTALCSGPQQQSQWTERWPRPHRRPPGQTSCRACVGSHGLMMTGWAPSRT